MKLTKAQRYKHYKIALRLFKEEKYPFLCSCLQYSFKDKSIQIFLSVSRNVHEAFPEFAKKKPKYAGHV